MTILRAHPLDPLYESGKHAHNDIDPSAVDIDAFLPALAGMLREAVSHFEITANRVSDLVLQQREQASLDLVIALQDFDRLQQEFSAIGDALFRYLAATGRGPAPAPEPAPLTGADVVSGIPLHDVKQRLLRRLHSGLNAGEAEDEQEF